MRIGVLAALGLLAIAPAYAQEFRGAFSGSVTDQQGAAVAKAKVVATETRTGTKSDTLSETSGAYTIPFLPPGEYEITVEAPGFKRFSQRGLTLSIGEHPVIDVRLEVGEATQSVTVSVDAPMIESANSSMGQVITTDEVEDFPANGRTPLMLSRLAMGVISTNEPGPVRPFDNGNTSQFSLAGAPSQSNELLLNGAPDGTWDKRIAYSPPQDAVQEVRVQAFETDAAYGHTGGGTANHITKGGTNSIHGSIYEFNQVSKLDANLFYSNKNGLARPVTNYNQYGISSGGPVWIPKVFNGRNKIFWFFAYEALKDSDPANSVLEGGATITTVPTAAERKGDFSALLNLNTPGTSYAIYDPDTGVPSGTHTARTPFPNNVIPSTRLNPIALNYLKYYPAPNVPGQSNGFDNFGIGVADTDVFNNELGRLDFNLSDRHKLSFDFRHNYRLQHKNIYFSNDAYGDLLSRENWGTSLDDVYTLSPMVVLDVRVNWTRFIEANASPGDGIDPGTLGFPSYIAANSQFPGLPYMQFGSCGSSYQCVGMTGDNHTPYDIYQLFGSIVKIHGNHSFKTGADIRDYRESAFAHGNSAGTYSFNSNWTRGPMENSATAPLGQEFAAFLLGLPSSGSFDLNTHSSMVAKYYALFLQDDWRARSNLTLNFGLRWEHETPTTERFDRAVDGFNPAASNPVSAPAAAAYAKSPIPQVPVSQFTALGGLTFASPGHPNVYSTTAGIFSPRVGFAWTPPKLGRRTVIRGGVGVFVAPTGINGSHALNQQGFSQTTQFVATDNNYLSPASTLSDPFPNGILSPAGASKGAGTFLGQSVTFFNPDVHNAYSLRFTFGVQRQLPGQMVLELAYIGNHAVRIPVGSTQLNYIPSQYLSAGFVRNNNTISLLSGSVANPFQGLLPNTTSLNGSTVALSQLVLPFPQFPVNGVTMQDAGAGSSYFHSFNVRLQKRFTHGLTLINNFMWNKLIERTAYLNPSDLTPEKRISSDSRPLREVIAATYQLPIGRGKPIDLRFRPANALLGGWAFNGILTLQTGPPLSWGNVIYYGGPLHLNSHQPDGPTFDRSQFNMVSNQQLSDNVRTFDTLFNNLRRDPTKNLDLSALKRFSLGERKYLQIRFETFNITNRVTFGAPQLSPTNSAFGQITSQANTPRRIQMGARLVW